MLNPDLTRLSDIGAIYHFKNHGISEGRLYKKNQKSEMPLFLKHYMNLIGFKI